MPVVEAELAREVALLAKLAVVVVAAGVGVVRVAVVAEAVQSHRVAELGRQRDTHETCARAGLRVALHPRRVAGCREAGGVAHEQRVEQHHRVVPRPPLRQQQPEVARAEPGVRAVECHQLAGPQRVRSEQVLPRHDPDGRPIADVADEALERRAIEAYDRLVRVDGGPRPRAGQNATRAHESAGAEPRGRSRHGDALQPFVKERAQLGSAVACPPGVRPLSQAQRLSEHCRGLAHHAFRGEPVGRW
jgi:hypothetical protein